MWPQPKSTEHILPDSSSKPCQTAQPWSDASLILNTDYLLVTDSGNQTKGRVGSKGIKRIKKLYGKEREIRDEEKDGECCLWEERHSVAPEPKMKARCFWREIGDELNKSNRLFPSFHPENCEPTGLLASITWTWGAALVGNSLKPSGGEW